MQKKFLDPNPWYVGFGLTADCFIKGMLTLGKPLELSLVGVFDTDKVGRGSRRDIHLPLHQDGIYSEELAKVQGGHYVENPNIDIVGLFCLQNASDYNPGLLKGGSPTDIMEWAKAGVLDYCITIIQDESGKQWPVELTQGQAVIFDNRRVLHGRYGPVKDRLLLRMWVQRHKPV